MLRVQYFSIIWKVSQILMTHKAGKPAHVVTSCRPISLLRILSKVFEKLLLYRIISVLEMNNVIPDHQFSFRKQHSTVKLARLKKSEKPFKKWSTAHQCFDRVWHKGIPRKVKSSLPHSYFVLFESYLLVR